MMPTPTDARGGGGGSMGGGFHGGGGHAFGFSHGAHGAPFTASSPPRPGPVGVHSFHAMSHGMSHRQNFSHASRTAFHRGHAVGSHVATLGYDGIWLDNYVYAPTVVVQQQPVVVLRPAQSRRGPAVKTPTAARSGILVVRGDTKSYVTFPGRNRG